MGNKKIGNMIWTGKGWIQPAINVPIVATNSYETQTLVASVINGGERLVNTNLFSVVPDISKAIIDINYDLRLPSGATDDKHVLTISSMINRKTGNMAVLLVRNNAKLADGTPSPMEIRFALSGMNIVNRGNVFNLPAGKSLMALIVENAGKISLVCFTSVLLSPSEGGEIPTTTEFPFIPGTTTWEPIEPTTGVPVATTTVAPGTSQTPGTTGVPIVTTQVPITTEAPTNPPTSQTPTTTVVPTLEPTTTVNPTTEAATTENPGSTTQAQTTTQAPPSTTAGPSGGDHPANPAPDYTTEAPGDHTTPSVLSAYNRYEAEPLPSTIGQVKGIYVNAAASGGGNGTQASPYNTLSAAISAANAGDTIYMHTGTAHTLSTGVNVPANVSITKYGDGDYATINCSSVSSRALILENSGTPVNSEKTTLSYLKMNGGNSCTTAVYIMGRHNVTIRNCYFNEFANFGVLARGISYLLPNKNLSIYDTSFINCSGEEWGVLTGAFTGTLLKNLLISGCTFRETKTPTGSEGQGWPIKMWYDGGINGEDGGFIYGGRITNCTVLKSLGNLWGGAYMGIAVEGKYLFGFEIDHNTICGGVDPNSSYSYDNRYIAENQKYDYGVWVHDNTIGFPDSGQDAWNTQGWTMPQYMFGIIAEIGARDLIVERNTFRNCPVLSGFLRHPNSSLIIEAVQNIIFRFNLAYNMQRGSDNSQPPFYMQVNDSNIGTLPVDGLYIYNNIFIGRTQNMTDNLIVVNRNPGSISALSNVGIYNNILMNCSSAAIHAGANVSTAENVYIDRNICYSVGSAVYSPYTLDSNTDNVVSNPNLGSAPDYYLTVNSTLAIGRGMVIEGPKISSLKDLKGASVNANAPNIGCYNGVYDSDTTLAPGETTTAAPQVTTTAAPPPATSTAEPIDPSLIYENYLYYSRDLNNGAWNDVASGDSAPTVTANQGLDLAGSNYMSMVTTHNDYNNKLSQKHIPVSQGTWYFSYDGKLGTSNDIRYVIWDEQHYQVISTGNMAQNLTGVVSRQTISFDVPSGCDTIEVEICIYNEGLGVAGTAGTIYLGRLQLASNSSYNYITTYEDRVIASLDPGTTEAPVTTSAPTTQAPTTQAPTTGAPTTQAATTAAPSEITYQLEIGSIGKSGANGVASTRLRTVGIVYVGSSVGQKEIGIHLAAGYPNTVYAYNGSAFVAQISFTLGNGQYNSENTLYVQNDGTFDGVRMVFRKSDNSDYTQTEADNSSVTAEYSAGGTTTAAATTTPTPVTTTVAPTTEEATTLPPGVQLNDKVIFLHHSVGGQLIADSHGGLGLALNNAGYFLSDISYEWDATQNTNIGDSMDIGNWYTWFADETVQSNSKARRDNIMGDVYTKYTQDAYSASNFGPYSRLVTDPTGENSIVIFKSCYSSGDIANVGSTTIRGIDHYSATYTIDNCKDIYNAILPYFKANPDKMFILFTTPPRPTEEGHTSQTYADNLRTLNAWLYEDWLSDGNWENRNVYVFDYHNILTNADNHHRYNNGSEERVIVTGSGNYLLSTYHQSGDEHPNAVADQKATTEFMSLLPYWKSLYYTWRQVTTTPAPTTAAPVTTQAATTTPTPTQAPTTAAPTTTPTPTQAPTTTVAPTQAPTQAPTTTPAPTVAPTTGAPVLYENLFLWSNIVETPQVSDSVVDSVWTNDNLGSINEASTFPQDSAGGNNLSSFNIPSWATGSGNVKLRQNFSVTSGQTYHLFFDIACANPANLGDCLLDVANTTSWQSVTITDVDAQTSESGAPAQLSYQASVGATVVRKHFTISGSWSNGDNLNINIFYGSCDGNAVTLYLGRVQLATNANAAYVQTTSSIVQ